MACQTSLSCQYISTLENATVQLAKQNLTLQGQVTACTMKTACVEAELVQEKATAQRARTMQNILSSNKQLTRYTGIPSLPKLYGLLNIVNRHYKKIKYWSGIKSASTKNYQEKPLRKPGRYRSLSRLEELVMCLVRLRTASSLWLMADMFDTSVTRITEVFATWITILAKVTKPLRRWPKKGSLRKHMPGSIKTDYPKTTCIIDCSEFFIHKPTNPTTQSQTYSSYKSHNTYKCLLGISSSGAFMYVSELYGGNASDRYIVEHSDFLSYIQRGDDVMADRGFTIRGLLAELGATLNMPPFTRKCAYGKGKRLNDTEIWKTRKIAKHRIHVERAIQRLKLFKLLTCEMPASLQDVANECVQVSAALCNMQPPLVKK